MYNEIPEGLLHNLCQYWDIVFNLYTLGEHVSMWHLALQASIHPIDSNWK